jgi:XK-related protein
LNAGVGQIVSCVSSLCSISWAMAAYQRALRASLPDKADLGYVQLVLMFLWRIFTVGARVLALALFASCFVWQMFIVAGIHWLIMFVWIYVQKTKFCRTKIEELFFDMVAACINIFDFFNLIEGHTRMRCLAYYGLVYAENAVMIVLYYVNSPNSQWYSYISMIAVLGLFFFGILLQLVYYFVYHPNNYSKDNKQHIKLCLTFNELMNCQQNEHSKGSMAVTV